mmetsp:Transcript_36888/g.88812  ORF Transcript_36888/g.88812 Transcript_36888/m.88812 type:complete len:231 (+) Transcript_36888:2311-3003(+)
MIRVLRSINLGLSKVRSHGDVRAVGVVAAIPNGFIDLFQGAIPIDLQELGKVDTPQLRAGISVEGLVVIVRVLRIKTGNASIHEIHWMRACLGVAKLTLGPHVAVPLLVREVDVLLVQQGHWSDLCSQVFQELTGQGLLRGEYLHVRVIIQHLLVLPGWRHQPASNLGVLLEHDRLHAGVGLEEPVGTVGPGDASANDRDVTFQLLLGRRWSSTLWGRHGGAEKAPQNGA